MNTSEFIHQVVTDCEKNDIKIVISPKDRVYYGDISCNGFFEQHFPVEYTYKHVLGEPTLPIDLSGNSYPLLAGCTGNKTDSEFISLLAHEYCHMQQFIEKSPLWITLDEFEKFEKWLGHESIDHNELITAWTKIVMLEADCEKRVVNLIADLDLPLDVNTYSRRANSYLFFYQWVLKNRKWYKTAPYEIESIVNMMPFRMLDDINEYVNSVTVPSWLMKEFDKCL